MVEVGGIKREVRVWERLSLWLLKLLRLVSKKLIVIGVGAEGWGCRWWVWF